MPTLSAFRLPRTFFKDKPFSSLTGSNRSVPSLLLIGDDFVILEANMLSHYFMDNSKVEGWDTGS